MLAFGPLRGTNFLQLVSRGALQGCLAPRAGPAQRLLEPCCVSSGVAPASSAAAAAAAAPLQLQQSRPAPSPQKGRPAGPQGGQREEEQEHKVFDEAYLTVRGGHGGEGEVVKHGSGKQVKNFKYKNRSNLPKVLWLPASAPADGADGGDVVLFADPACENLLHLRTVPVRAAKNGKKGDPRLGSEGPKRATRRKADTPATRIGVPLGTVVKRRKGGQLLGELIHAGQSLVVAKGGRGGYGVVQPPKRPPKPPGGNRSLKYLLEEGKVADERWREDMKGLEGEEVSLQLMLRVVADVGLVGLPNAGKSSILAALTRAHPDIAPYPFTTLMPNLGVIPATGAPLGAGLSPSGEQQLPLQHYEGGDAGFPEASHSSFGGDPSGRVNIPRRQAGLPSEALEASGEALWGAGSLQPGPILADLPGLIEGAHHGRGLGRVFLRHLKRTRSILHVLDASAEAPGLDYAVVRRELALYNPEYCARPHVVALNKMDLADAHDLRLVIEQSVLEVAQQLQGEAPHPQAVPSLPSAVVCVSAVAGTGLPHLIAALHRLMGETYVPPELPKAPRGHLLRRAPQPRAGGAGL